MPGVQYGRYPITHQSTRPCTVYAPVQHDIKQPHAFSCEKKVF